MYRNSNSILAIENIGKVIKFAGWVASKRDHGGLVFFDVRDAFGILQVVFDEEMIANNDLRIHLESVISIEGVIQKREDDQINDKIPSGTIELRAQKITILSLSDTLPIEINNNNISEELKLKHRVLYLRGEKMTNNLKTRAKLLNFLRNKLTKDNFLEVQTPLITASSPEGARDFVIPSRLHPGKFYALPQAPQIFKQLLMASGVDRYFQIAPCFRDEDARKDRCYGEFYQLDCEMSFVEQEDVLSVLRDIARSVIKEFTGKESSMDRLTYRESLEIYGSDKPDLRNPLRIENFSKEFLESDMDIFKNLIKNGSVVRGLRVNLNFGSKSLNNSMCKNILIKIEQEYKFKIAYLIKEDGELKGPLSKFLKEEIINNNEVIFFVCDKYAECNKKLDILRNFIPHFVEFFLDPKDFRFLEVVDFPMFEKDEKSITGWQFMHNPFSKPKNLNVNSMDEVEANQYDLVLNGVEICSGSIRNTSISDLIRCFEIVGTPEFEVRDKFHSMISGFKYGVPPHGGFAIGVDRLLMIILDEENVREVVAFPLNTNGVDPLMRTPSFLSKRQMTELKLK